MATLTKKRKIRKPAAKTKKDMSASYKDAIGQQIDDIVS